MEKFMKSLSSLVMAVLVLASVGACNTVAGVGKDVERGGEKIQDTARDVQKKN
jgi:entericidin B